MDRDQRLKACRDWEAAADLGSVRAQLTAKKNCGYTPNSNKDVAEADNNPPTNNNKEPQNSSAENQQEKEAEETASERMPDDYYESNGNQEQDNNGSSSSSVFLRGSVVFVPVWIGILSDGSVSGELIVVWFVRW